MKLGVSEPDPVCSYLPFGPADHWVDGNGVATDISYDQDYRVTGIDAHGNSDILSLGYTYNDNSNITAMADKLGLDSQQFGYDALNRLTSAAGQYGDIDYNYDGVGDRTRRTLTQNGATTSEDYAYETGSHRLQSVTTTDGSGTSQRTFGYDANGNTISDSSPARVLQLAFNARNRLSTITKDGATVGEYEYNALGQRVAKTSTYVGRIHANFNQGNGAAASNGKGKGNANANPQSNLHVTTDNTSVTEHLQFVYDAQGNLIAENDANGNVIREYIYLGSRRIAMTATTLDHPEVTPTVVSTGAERPQRLTLSLYFIHNDHLGTPRDVTDANQNVVWAMHQTPFGEATLDTEAIRMPMRFPGQYADIESGLNYNYFRDYDPTLGRYVESDPIGLYGGTNTYAFVHGDPLNRIDPFGDRGYVGLGWSGGVFGDVVGGYGSTQGALGFDKSWNFHACWITTACAQAGLGMEGGTGLSGVFSTQELCPVNNQVTGGIFGRGGDLLGAGGSLMTNGDGYSLNLEIGVEAGAAGGAQLCTKTVECAF